MAAKKKTTLVLIPGLLADRALWRHQIAHLHDIADVFIPDTTSAKTMKDFGRSILDQIEAPRFALGGQSLGGYVAYEIMRQAPERVTKLALFDTTARGYTEEQRKLREAWVQMVAQKDIAVSVDELSVTLLHPLHRENKEMVAELRAQGLRIGKDACLRQLGCMLTRPDSRADFPNIKVPTVVIGGRNDIVLPIAEQGEQAAGIKGARFVPIEDSGHFTQFEQPQAVTAVLRYWLQEG